MNRFANVNTDL